MSQDRRNDHLLIHAQHAAPLGFSVVLLSAQHYPHSAFREENLGRLHENIPILDCLFIAAHHPETESFTQ